MIASLFPIPTPDAVRQFVLAMISGGLALGKLMSDAVFLFIEKLFTGLA